MGGENGSLSFHDAFFLNPESSREYSEASLNQQPADILNSAAPLEQTESRKREKRHHMTASVTVDQNHKQLRPYVTLLALI